MGAGLEVHHSNLRCSGGGVGRVSAALNFLSNLPALAYFSDLCKPMAGITRQVLFLVVCFSMGLCVEIFVLFATL